MVPAAINDQVGQAVSTADSLAVHGETGLGLVGFSPSSALLEASAFRTGGKASHICLGHGGEANEQEDRQQSCEQTGKKTAHWTQGRGARCHGLTLREPIQTNANRSCPRNKL